MSKKIAHAWIREVRSDGSHHRVGCMVAERINDTNAKVAFSLCAPGDKMDVKKAKRLAMRRLTEFKTKSIVISGITKNFHMSWADVFSLDNVIVKHFVKNKRRYSDKNTQTFKGLISEVCPQV